MGLGRFLKFIHERIHCPSRIQIHGLSSIQKDGVLLTAHQSKGNSRVRNLEILPQLLCHNYTPSPHHFLPQFYHTHPYPTAITPHPSKILPEMYPILPNPAVCIPNPTTTVLCPLHLLPSSNQHFSRHDSTKARTGCRNHCNPAAFVPPCTHKVFKTTYSSIQVHPLFIESNLFSYQSSRNIHPLLLCSHSLPHTSSSRNTSDFSNHHLYKVGQEPITTMRAQHGEILTYFHSATAVA